VKNTVFAARYANAGETTFLLEAGNFPVSLATRDEALCGGTLANVGVTGYLSANGVNRGREAVPRT